MQASWCKKWDKAVGHKLKDIVKLDWVTEKKKVLKRQKHTYAESYKRVETSKGEYLCLAMVAEKMGFLVDPEGAIERAVKYCTKCALMGGAWITWDGMIEEHLYLLLRRMWKDELEHAWAEYSEYGDREEKPEAVASEQAAAPNEEGGGQEDEGQEEMDDLERYQGIPPVHKKEEYDQWQREFQAKWVAWWNSPWLSEYCESLEVEREVEKEEEEEEEEYWREEVCRNDFEWQCW